MLSVLKRHAIPVLVATRSARAISRWRRPSAHLSRSISLLLRIGSLSVAILASSTLGRGRPRGRG
jgi:hypothetical protein